MQWIDEAAIRRIFKQHARGLIQRWVKVTDTAMHEQPRGFPGFKTSPAAFLMDAIGHNRLPPDWIHEHEKARERAQWDERRVELALKERTLRQRYCVERDAALQEYLTTVDGRSHFNAVHTTSLEFYRTVEPDRFREAAQVAVANKVEREHFQFPDFSVWLLNQRAAR